tara:strand:- start:1620 stop:2318 length:699 start_codon:yes stop_codon:yes gene_type:complete
MSIKKIIAIGSAKGGVGKSSITASIALYLSNNYSVGILDADIYGPNQHLLFNIIEKPSFTKSNERKLLNPIIKKNIQFSSVGFLLEEEKAAMWRGPILSSTIKQLFYSTQWKDLDFLFIDMPPGTGDAYLTVLKDINVDDFILVTSNNKLSISDSLKTLTMTKKFNINVIGYIENNLITNTQSNNKNIFNSEKINYLGSVNFDPKIYNFDTNHVSGDIIAISEMILSTINKI